MELVLLGDIQGGYGSNWYRVANTEGVSEIQIGDRFREKGYGPGSEELEVAGVDISVVGGFSRIFFNRAANATQPEVHRLGAVLLPTSADNLLLAANGFSRSETQTESLVVPSKPRRGRPPGSRNKSKQEVSFPTGF